MKDPRVAELGEAVLSWLSFQWLCGRSSLLSEHYLSQPIGEFLLYHHSGKLLPEFDHPNLNPQGKKGRPRQIDFCLESRDTNRITAAFELKWVSTTPIDKQRIVDDLLRLEALRIKEKQYVYRYFLIAGRTDDFQSNFIEAEANLGAGGGRINFFAELLHFDKTDNLKIITSRLSQPQRSAFDEFSQYYQSQLPKQFFTTLIFSNTSNGFSVHIWKIHSAKKRSTLPIPK